MARVVGLRNPDTEILTVGFSGFSWTMLLFGFFVPLFRGDLVTSLLLFVLQTLFALFFRSLWGFGFWIPSTILAFFYNRSFTTKLLEAGYEFHDTSEKVAAAERKLRIAQKRRH